MNLRGDKCAKSLLIYSDVVQRKRVKSEFIIVDHLVVTQMYVLIADSLLVDVGERNAYL